MADAIILTWLLASSLLAVTRLQVWGATSSNAALGHLEPGDQFNRDVRVSLPGRAWTDPDTHVHTECIQKALKTLLAKASQLPSHQVGDIWWSNPKHVSRTALRPLLVLDDVPNHARELRLREPLAGIGQSQVFKDVAAARFNRDRLFLRAFCFRHRFSRFR